MTTEARNAAIRRAIEDYTNAATESKQKAKEALVKEGIYMPAGELTPEYREDGKRAA
jgi:hypothetical protein